MTAGQGPCLHAADKDLAQDAGRPPEYVVETWVSKQLHDRIQRTGPSLAEGPANTGQANTRAAGRQGGRTVTTTQSHPGMTNHTAIVRRGIAARIRAIGERLSHRVHAAADDRARALGWVVTETPGRLGLSGRSYRDPRVRRGTPEPPGRAGRKW